MATSELNQITPRRVPTHRPPIDPFRGNLILLLLVGAAIFSVADGDQVTAVLVLVLGYFVGRMTGR